MAEFQTPEDLRSIATLFKVHDVHLFDDIPPSIRGGFATAWVALFTLFWVFFAWGLEATFAVMVSTLFAIMYFGVPIIMARQTSPRSGYFASEIQTCTGPVSTSAAAVQIMLIPVALMIAIGVMGVMKVIIF
jgi:hypothetical protein